MTCSVHVSWDERLTDYDFGPQHPLAPIRVKLTMELARAFGVLSQDEVTVIGATPATDAELQLVHDPGYITVVKAAGAMASGAGTQAVDAATLLKHGLGTDDDPVFSHMHEASALVAGATLAAARAAWSGAAQHGVSIAGGLHHAMRSNASGFCIYNDPAIAIAWLLENGAERIAYVDIDVHHGDGVQAAFWNDPRVLTISVHQHPATLFPGTGRPTETGGTDADGSAVNVALPAGTRDAGWLRALHAIVPPLVRQFRPQILVTQHGCDTHWSDPLANLAITIDAQRAAHAALHQLAHEAADGRWLLTGGGGYQLVQVVPRTWTHLLAEASGTPIQPGSPTPVVWREYVGWVAAEPPPELMTEGADATFPDFDAGYDPADPVDQAIIATRNAVFPLLGLFP
ncbi:MAG TPA: acetoin utilization protein AcuC [Streptosporangiaceae bacterium]|nr:acetoin utilization protein AcuC [Streptosporangiaceae bacterium]